MCPDEVRRLVLFEPQVAGADLGELAANAKPAETEGRIASRRDHESNVVGAEFDQSFDAGVDRRVVDEVEVVDDDDERRRRLGEDVDQRRDHGVDRSAGGDDRRSDGVRDAGAEQIDRRHQVRPETDGVGIAGLDLQPGEVVVSEAEASGEEGRLSRSGGGTHEDEAMTFVDRPIEEFVESSAANEVARRRRGPQLGADQLSKVLAVIVADCTTSAPNGVLPCDR